MLSSDHIIQAMDILKSQFDQIGGLIDTLLFSSSSTCFIESRLVFKAKNIFILHTPNLSHWVVITNINHHDEGKWLFLDSLNHLRYLKSLRSTIISICSSDTASKNRIEVYTVNMAQQTGTYDSGIFAIAYTVDLCLNNNPANVVYDRNSMRLHYAIRIETCIANR